MRIEDFRAALAKVDVVINGGDTYDTILEQATFKGLSLTARQKALIRRKLLNMNKRATKRPGYREAVEYLASNDDFDLALGNPTTCVSMIAHLFGKADDTVIGDVLAYREKHDV
jgi:cytidylate kinase